MAAFQPGDDEDWMDQEILARLEGPATVAAVTFVGLLAAGRFREAWALADPEWQLSQLQVWIWYNRSHPAFAGGDLDQAATDGMDGPSPRAWWWPNFADDVGARWPTRLPTGAANWARVTPPLLVDIDYEMVEIVNAPPSRPEDSLRVVADRWVLSVGSGKADGIQVLVHLVHGRWLVAAVGPRHRPGWPPTFVDGSPAV